MCQTAHSHTPHSLLSPVGQHRKAYVKASKGKRAKRAAKRKRGQEDEPQGERSMPPPPEVASLVDVGLSNITRNLQVNAGKSATDDSSKQNDTTANPKSQIPYSVIFFSRSGPQSALLSHLPQMVAVASKAQQLLEPTRLVGLSRSFEERLTACMGIPRVTSVALRVGDLAQLEAVADFVRERVPPVKVRWLDEAALGIYQEAKIDTIRVPIGEKRQKKG